MDDLVTVFGGSGFVGNNVVRMLARDGWRVRVAVRNPHLAEHVRVHGVVGQIQPVAANVRLPDSVARALDGAVACVNLVGVLQERGRQRFATVHTGGARNVAEAAAAQGVERFVQMSALGSRSSVRVQVRPQQGRGRRGGPRRRRHGGDHAPLRGLRKRGPILQPLRRHGGYGPGAALIGGGETRFQPVYVGDVARAVAVGLKAPAARGKIFELGGPKVYTFREILELVLRETGRKRVLLPLPFFAARAIGTVSDLVAPILPFETPITKDQVELLRRDNVVTAGYPGLADLGITPVAAEGLIGSYLYRFRKAGQFSTLEPEKSASGANP
jgi:NADH dehydrogenase